MKKTYIKPNMESINLQGACVLSTVSGGGLSVGISNTGASSDADGRGNDGDDW